jgi:small-conductance mechanosensitive channel
MILEKIVFWWRALSEGTATGVQAAMLGMVTLFIASLMFGLMFKLFLPWLLRFVNEPPNSKLPRKLRLTFLLAVLLGVTLVMAAAMTSDAGRETFRFKMLEFLFAMSLVLLFGEVVIIFVVRATLERGAGIQISALFRDVLRFVIYVLALMIAFRGILNVDVSSLLTTSAIFSIIIGLALQDTLGSIFAGVFLHIDRPLEVGHAVKIGEFEGEVLEMNWRSMKILTWTGDVVSIPNGTVSKSEIFNYSMPTKRHMLKKRVGISYSVPPNRVRAAIVKVLSEHPLILKDPAWRVLLVEYGDSAMVYEIRFWIDDFDNTLTVGTQVMEGLWYEFRRQDIEIPFPIRNVYIQQPKAEENSVAAMELMRKVDVFTPIANEDLKQVAQEAKQMLFAKGERICSQGQEGDSLCLIRNGSVSVSVKTQDGQDVQVAELGAGSFFGEMSLLTGEKRNKPALSLLLRQKPESAEAMSRILAHRVAGTRERLEGAMRETTVTERYVADTQDKVATKILGAIKWWFSPKA